MASHLSTQPKHPPRFLIPVHYNPDDWKNSILDKDVYTRKDYEKLPEGAPYQLIGGKLIMTPAPEVQHQRVSRDVGFKLHEFIKKNGLGEVFLAPIDVQLSEHDVYQPDIVFIHKDRLDVIGRKKIEAAPDIVMEILSPSTGYYDLKTKYDSYEQAGVKEYWIIDHHRKKVDVYQNKNGKFQLHNESGDSEEVVSAILPEFSISLAELFD